MAVAKELIASLRQARESGAEPVSGDAKAVTGFPQPRRAPFRANLRLGSARRQVAREFYEDGQDPPKGDPGRAREVECRRRRHVAPSRSA